MADETGPDQTVPDQTVPDQTVPDQTVPDQTVPDDLRYTAEHEWVRRTDDVTVRVGITAYAQSQLGDVVFVQLPEVGTAARPGAALGEVESTKSVSDVFAPLAGTVSARNEVLDTDPELVNTDPYGAGWLVEIALEDATAVDESLAEMLDAAGYQNLTGGQD